MLCNSVFLMWKSLCEIWYCERLCGGTIFAVCFVLSGETESETSYREDDSTRKEYVCEFHDNEYARREQYYDRNGNLESEAQYNERIILIQM